MRGDKSQPTAVQLLEQLTALAAQLRDD